MQAASHGPGGDEIFFTEGCLDTPTIEMTFGAISLNASWRTGKASACVALQSLIDRKCKFAVEGCRDRSRRVVGHALMITRSFDRVAGYPQIARVSTPLGGYKFNRSRASQSLHHQHQPSVPRPSNSAPVRASSFSLSWRPDSWRRLTISIAFLTCGPGSKSRASIISDALSGNWDRKWSAT